MQTWLYVNPKFDSKELRQARKQLAQQLDSYDPEKRAEIDDAVLDFFESVGALYKRNLLNKELAASFFSFEKWTAAILDAGFGTRAILRKLEPGINAASI